MVLCQGQRSRLWRAPPGGSGKPREPSRWQGEWSEHAEALAALTDGQLQHPVHLFVGVIRREAQLVETRVCSWERAVGRGCDNLEGGTEGSKASGWQLRGACGELQ